MSTPDPLRGVREVLQQQGERHARLVDAFTNGPGAQVARAMDEQAAGVRALQQAMKKQAADIQALQRAAGMQALQRVAANAAENVRRFQEVTLRPLAAAATAGVTRAVVTTTRNLRKVARVALQATRERYRRGRALLAALLGRTSREQAGAFARAPRVITSREGPPGAAAPALRLVSSLVDAPGAPPSRAHSHNLTARVA